MAGHPGSEVNLMSTPYVLSDTLDSYEVHEVSVKDMGALFLLATQGVERSKQEAELAQKKMDEEIAKQQELEAKLTAAVRGDSQQNDG